MKDSNLRSFRDGFTARRGRFADLTRCGGDPHFRAISAQTLGIPQALSGLFGRARQSVGRWTSSRCHVTHYRRPILKTAAQRWTCFAAPLRRLAGWRRARVTTPWSECRLSVRWHRRPGPRGASRVLRRDSVDATPQVATRGAPQHPRAYLPRWVPQPIAVDRTWIQGQLLVALRRRVIRIPRSVESRRGAMASARTPSGATGMVRWWSDRARLARAEFARRW